MALHSAQWTAHCTSVRNCDANGSGPARLASHRTAPACRRAGIRRRHPQEASAGSALPQERERSAGLRGLCSAPVAGRPQLRGTAPSASRSCAEAADAGQNARMKIHLRHDMLSKIQTLNTRNDCGQHQPPNLCRNKPCCIRGFTCVLLYVGERRLQRAKYRLFDTG